MFPEVKLGSLCSLVNGRAFKPTDWSESGVPIIRIQNLNGPNGGFNYWSGPVDKQVRVAHNDLLLAWSGTPGSSFGAHIWRGGNAVLNQHIFRVDIDKTRITKEWALSAINHRLNRLIELAHGGVGLKHVTRGVVEELSIPLPRIDEQRRIAAILDKAEFLRAKRREGLRKSELLEAGTFYAAFGVSAEWESERIVPLESVCSQITDGAHQTPTYVDEGIPFVTVTNITSGNLDLSGTKFISKQEHESLTKRTRPEYGDILVSKDGTIGVPCPVLTDEEFSIFVSVALLKLRRDVIDPVFLTAQLRLSWVQRQIIAGTKGIAIRHLHLSDFKRLRIFVPPLSQQKRFASQVEAIGVFNTRLINSLSGFDTLVASLQHRAFRGEL